MRINIITEWMVLDIQIKYYSLNIIVPNNLTHYIDDKKN